MAARQTDPHYQIKVMLRAIRTIKRTIIIMEQELSEIKVSTIRERTRLQTLERVRKHRANKRRNQEENQ